MAQMLPCPRVSDCIRLTHLVSSISRQEAAQGASLQPVTPFFQTPRLESQSCACSTQEGRRNLSCQEACWLII